MFEIAKKLNELGLRVGAPLRVNASISERKARIQDLEEIQSTLKILDQLLRPQS